MSGRPRMGGSVKQGLSQERGKQKEDHVCRVPSAPGEFEAGPK